MIVFILLARGLGPYQFGFVTTVFAYATLGSLLTDFGFQTKALRDIAADPASAAQAVGEMLQFKVLLVAAVSIVGGTFVALLNASNLLKISAAALSLGVLIASIGDLSLVTLRATRRFGQEAVLVAWTSSLYGVAIGVATILHAGIVGTSLCFLLSRLIYAYACLRATGRALPGVRFGLARPRSAVATARGGFSWALDSGLNYFNSQIDSIIAAHMLGLSAAGIYQGGARFTQAGLGLVGILSNVHIPALAADRCERSRRRRGGRMVSEFAVFGAALGFSLLAAGPTLTKYLLGQQYHAVNGLWTGLAAFIFARYVAAGVGATLAATNQPTLRVVGQLAGLGIIIASVWLFLPSRGLPALPWIMAGGGVATALVYAIGSSRGYVGLHVNYPHSKAIGPSQAD